MSDFDQILTSLDGGVLTVTLNRPDSLNGVTAPMWAHMKQTFNDAATNPEVRVVVLAGNGRAFCAGADLWAEPGEGPPLAALDAMRVTHAAALALHELPKPTVARVNGVAVGAGWNLALGCDLIVASTEARFSQIFAKRGLSLDFGGSWHLARMVGIHKAKEIALLAEMISAQEAESMGLVNRLVGPDELDAAVDEIVGKLVAGPPLALSSTKKLLNHSMSRTMAEALEAESLAQAFNLGTSDTREAIAAFTEKRDPVYKGR